MRGVFARCSSPYFPGASINSRSFIYVGCGTNLSLPYKRRGSIGALGEGAANELAKRPRSWLLPGVNNKMETSWLRDK